MFLLLSRSVTVIMEIDRVAFYDILSPPLFSIYIGGLTGTLASSETGWFINDDVCFDPLFYADCLWSS